MKENENIEILDDITGESEQHIAQAIPSPDEENVSVMPVSPDEESYSKTEDVEQFDFENLFGAEVEVEEPPILPIEEELDFAPQDPLAVKEILDGESNSVTIAHGVQDTVPTPTRRKRTKVNLPKLDVKKVTQSVKNMDEQSKNTILFIGALMLLIAVVIFLLPLLLDIFGY